MTAAESYYTLDGKTAADRRASLSAVDAAYRRRFHVAPPWPARVFRVGRTVYAALALTHIALTGQTPPPNVPNDTMQAGQMRLELG